MNLSDIGELIEKDSRNIDRAKFFKEFQEVFGFYGDIVKILWGLCPKVGFYNFQPDYSVFSDSLRIEIVDDVSMVMNKTTGITVEGKIVDYAQAEHSIEQRFVEYCRKRKQLRTKIEATANAFRIILLEIKADQNHLRSVDFFSKEKLFETENIGEFLHRKAPKESAYLIYELSLKMLGPPCEWKNPALTIYTPRVNRKELLTQIRIAFINSLKNYPNFGLLLMTRNLGADIMKYKT